MKFLLQFISLYMPEANSLQAVAAAGSVIAFIKINTNKLFSKGLGKVKAGCRETEEDMWQIE